MREKTPRPTDGTLKLFIGNVAYEATDSDVRKLFEPVAPIRGVRWVTHKHSGEFKGCGYLSFHSVRGDRRGAGAARRRGAVRPADTARLHGGAAMFCSRRRRRRPGDQRPALVPGQVTH